MFDLYLLEYLFKFYKYKNFIFLSFYVSIVNRKFNQIYLINLL